MSAHQRDVAVLAGGVERRGAVHVRLFDDLQHRKEKARPSNIKQNEKAARWKHKRTAVEAQAKGSENTSERQRKHKRKAVEAQAKGSENTSERQRKHERKAAPDLQRVAAGRVVQQRGDGELALLYQLAQFSLQLQ